MPDWRELAPFLALGLLGAAHCAGMCGGFAIAVAASAGRARRRVLARELVYVLGKALTYTVLGLLAAHAGELFGRGGAALAPGERGSAAGFELARRMAAVACGAALIVAGLVALRRARGQAAPDPLALRGRLSQAFARMGASVRRLPGATGALGTGLLTGLLPCGLSFGALVLAAASGPAAGALGMFLFGLSTAPVLIALGLGSSGVPLRWRARLAVAVGPLLVVLGLLTVMRGLPPETLGPAARVMPDCCAQPGATE